MANPSISYPLPSQKELEPHEIVLDSLEKLRALSCMMGNNSYIEQHTDPLSVHHYVTLIDDLIEIAIFQFQEAKGKGKTVID